MIGRRRFFSLAGLALSVALTGLLINSDSALSEDVDPWQALPAGTTYDPNVPTIESFLGGGFHSGKRHLHHHELAAYLQALAAASPRVTVSQYGRTYGGKPLLAATFTSVDNQPRLDELAARRQTWCNPRAEREEIDHVPLVVYLGYSVHGNEASGGNAAPLVAYYLAAAQGEAVDQLLRNTVILLDPCLNPDGFERFAFWVNNHRGQVANGDPMHREHRETWPGGRTNYYWFDLNRDWLPAQHPESQGRLALFRRWMPNVALDFHEMGNDHTFFFQPGVPARKHPLIPAANVDLTRRLATFHSTALDKVGALYFTEEMFDDFYPGKGSTYPDLHGGVGILFEQASSRGRIQESDHGLLSFDFTVRNQVLTSMSSLEAAAALRKELLEHQRKFYEAAIAEAAASTVKAHLLSAPHDPVRRFLFYELLQRHGIRSYPLAHDVQINDASFAAGDGLLIPVDQPEYRFLQALLERRTNFQENIFYDVSTWALPLAFGFKEASVEQIAAEWYDPGATLDYPARELAIGDDDFAYVVDWRGYYAPRTLYRLLAADILVKCSEVSFAVVAGGQPEEFESGSLLIPLGLQADKREQIQQILKTAASEDGVRIVATNSGLTPDGIDLGSSSFRVVRRPQIAVLTGDGVDGYEAGEVWHALDSRFQIPLTLLDVSNVAGADLKRYTTLVMPGGRYAGLPEPAKEKLKQWVTAGGTLIVQSTACQWLADTQWIPLKLRSRAKPPTARRPYAAAGDDAALQQIAGAAFRVLVDTTHPLGYGLPDSLAVFRDHTTMLEPAENAYATPLIYAPQPLLSGYTSRENQERLAGSASAIALELGSGRVLVLTDNPNFRAFWLGTNRLFLNAVFYGPLIRVRTAGQAIEE
jgi:hypothetical protein